MIALFGLLYAVLILSIIIAGIFIVFHIVRYSIQKTAKLVMLAIFLSVLIFLLVVNVASFLSLRPQEALERFNIY